MPFASPILPSAFAALPKTSDDWCLSNGISAPTVRPAGRSALS
jgi:hypothetical protein